jgi:hypothetical protein
MELWPYFFQAQVGASAALVGLIFVSISISLSRILAVAHLPARAMEALLGPVDIHFAGRDAGILRVGQEQGATRCQSIASAAVTQPTHKIPRSLWVAQGWASAASPRVART